MELKSEIINAGSGGSRDINGLYITIENIQHFPPMVPLLIPPHGPVAKQEAKGVRSFVDDRKTRHGAPLSKEILDHIKTKLPKLKRGRVSSEEFILAYPNDFNHKYPNKNTQQQGSCGRYVSTHGEIHRDVKNQTDTLTVIVFNQTAETGAITLWLGSEYYLPGVTEFEHIDNVMRDLDTKYERVTIHPKKGTAVVFDSKLMHQSMCHQEPNQRISYSFYVYLGRVAWQQPPGHFLTEDKYKWVDIASIEEIKKVNSTRRKRPRIK